MVGAKQLKTQDLSWFRPGAVRPAVVCSRHCIALHRGACSGAATSKAGEEARPPSPWWSDQSEFRCCGRIGECICVVPYWMSDVSCPLRRRGSPFFYRARMGRITVLPHCLATWGSMACSATELEAVLTVLATILYSWRVLYPNSGSFEGRGVVVDRGIFRRARGGR
jgi:hypothetical protein